jgi:nitrite transporter NirC
MFRDTILALCSSAEGKLRLLEKNPIGYFISAMMAGAFIALGGFVSVTMGGLATAAGCTVTKLVMALLFAAALSLVISAGGELFTGNNLTMTAAALEGRVRWGKVLKLWAVCWLGNLAGSWVMVLLYQLSGAGATESVAAMFASIAAAKVALSPLQMVVRGILCNLCVCLAVWCAAKLKSECARLIMTVWCILIFMICGFEHSIANMSMIGVALLNPAGETIPVSGYVVNLLLVTLGNLIGGAGFVALPYWTIGKE